MKTLLTICLLLIGDSISFGQLLQVYERNNSNNTILLNQNGITDINSDLELKISKKELALNVGSTIESNQEIIAELKKYDNILINQKEVLETLNQNISLLTPSERIKELGNYSDLLVEFYNKIKPDKDLRKKVNKYMGDFLALDEIESKKYNNSAEAYAMTQLTAEMADKIAVIEASMEKEQIKIRLTAFIDTKEERNKKVHIENFDTYSAGEFYDVERWATSFSKEDMAAFDKTNKLAKGLNSMIDKSFKEISQSLINNNFTSVKALDSLLTQLKDLNKNKNTLFKTNIELADSFLTAIQNEASAILITTGKIDEYNTKGTNVLELFNKVNTDFIEKANSFYNNTSTLESMLPVSFTNANPEIINLLSSIKNCRVLVNDDLKKINSIIKITANSLNSFKNTAEKGMEMGGDVINHSLKDLPELGFITLKNAGKRANGDKLTINLMVITDSEIKDKKPGTVIEKHILTMQQLKVYSVSSVSVILAHPYGDIKNVKLENQFQFAPSGSLLFKVGSRKSKTWNYIAPGLGFNVSTLDFDLDGVPDVGMGGVVTLLHDVLSFGVSYNTKTDNPFWFFGLSLPFSLVGVPINTVQTNAGN